MVNQNAEMLWSRLQCDGHCLMNHLVFIHSFTISHFSIYLSERMILRQTKTSSTFSNVNATPGCVTKAYLSMAISSLFQFSLFTLNPMTIRPTSSHIRSLMN